MPAPRPAWDRFWEKVDASGDCWEWTGSKRLLGYGQFWFEGRGRGAHRVAYTLLVGPIPPGLELDHLCRNSSCVNPDHLEPVTRKTNALRGYAPAIRQTKAAYCTKGHALTPDNVAPRSDTGGRRCLTCRREYHRHYQREWRLR